MVAKTTSAKKLKATVPKTTNAKKMKSMVSKKTAMEDLLGPKLLTSNVKAVPTSVALKGKDLVALYFGASWYQKCRAFDPILTEFYNKYSHASKLEIVYMSSDSTVEQFNDYFPSMPWVALPIDREGGLTKGNIAKSLKIKGIPVLVVLDANTGHLVSDQGYYEVDCAVKGGCGGGDGEKVEPNKACKDLLTTWKTTKPLPFHEAALTGGLPSWMSLSTRDKIWNILKNKWFILVLIFLLYKF